MTPKVVIGLSSDHGGYLLKETLRQYITISYDLKIIDFGCQNDQDSVDYPEYVSKLCLAIKSKQVDLGVAVCGTGIGASIVCNRFSFIRAALCHNVYTAEMSKKHNDANILVLGGRVVNKELSKEIFTAFLTNKFEGGRHLSRLNQIQQVSKND